MENLILISRIQKFKEEEIDNMSLVFNVCNHAMHPKTSLVFEEECHRYSLEDQPWRKLSSVTTKLSDFFPFEATKIATDCVKRKYAALSEAEIVSAAQQLMGEWKEKGRVAASKGTALHENIEDFLNNVNPKREKNKTENKQLVIGSGDKKPISLCRPVSTVEPHFDQFQKFHAFMQNRGYIPLISELRLFHKEACLAGTIDQLYIHKDNYVDDIFNPKGESPRPCSVPIVMVDWKRTSAIKSYSYNNGEFFFSHMGNSAYSKYCMQQNMYKTMLENQYPHLHVETMYLVNFTPRTYQITPVPVFKHECSAFIQLQRLLAPEWLNKYNEEQPCDQEGEKSTNDDINPV